MTNDFSVEQKRPSAAPYGIVGLAAGAGLGTQLPKWTGKPKTVDQLIEDMNNKDEFTKNTAEGAEHATEWKDLHAQAEKVKAAEKAAEDASKPQLTSGAEFEAKKKVEKEAEDKLASMRAEAARKAGKTETVTTGTKIVEYNPNWQMTESEVTEYKKLYQTYTDELAKLKGNADYTNVVDDISNRRTLIEDMVKDTKSEVDKAIELRKTAENEARKKGKTLKSKYQNLPANRQEFVDRFAKDSFAELLESSKTVKLTDNELIDIAKNKLLDKAPDKGTLNKDYFEVTKGDKKYYVQFDSAQKKLYQEKLSSKIEGEAQKLTNNYIRMTDLQELLSDTTEGKTKLVNELKLDKGSLRTAGFVDGSKDRASNIIAKVKEWSGAKAEIEKDIKVIKDAGMANYAPLEEVTNSEVKAIIDKYKDQLTKTYDPKTKKELAKTPKDVYTMLSERLGIIRKYDSGVEGFNKELDSLYKDCDNVLADLIKKKDGMTSKELKAAENQIRGKYGKFLEKVKTTKVSDSADGVIKEITESDLPQELKDRLAKAREAYEAAAKNGGKIDEAAKKAADELLSTEKEKLTKMGEELSGKIGKVPGMKKGWGVALGAIALGVVGLGIGKAVNKNKNA